MDLSSQDTRDDTSDDPCEADIDDSWMFRCTLGENECDDENWEKDVVGRYLKEKPGGEK